MSPRRRQADEFRSIALNQMAEGLIATDDQGRLTYMNAAVTRMLGWTEEDLKDKHLHDVIHTHHEDGRPILSQAECAHNRVRTEARVMHEDNLVYTCKDGSFLPVSYSAAPITTDVGVGGTVIVFRDITEEKAERLQRETASWTRSVGSGASARPWTKTGSCSIHSRSSRLPGVSPVRNFSSGWWAGTARSSLLGLSWEWRRSTALLLRSTGGSSSKAPASLLRAAT